MAKKRAIRRKTKKVKRKTTKTKRKASKTKRKVSKTKRKTKKAFGGYSISFKNRDESLEQVFGKTNIAPSEMTKNSGNLLRIRNLVISKIIPN